MIGLKSKPYAIDFTITGTVHEDSITSVSTHRVRGKAARLRGREAARLRAYHMQNACKTAAVVVVATERRFAIC
jgi:hypothetical protein